MLGKGDKSPRGQARGGGRGKEQKISRWSQRTWPLNGLAVTVQQPPPERLLTRNAAFVLVFLLL